MCGVLGMFGECPAAPDLGLFRDLLVESRVRGTHAAGFAWSDPAPGLGAGCHRSTDFEQVLRLLDGFRGDVPRIMIGHTRYSTSGDWRDDANNQPVSACGRFVAMNGVLDGGTRAEFNARWGVACAGDNDAEIFPRRLELGQSAAEFARSVKGSLAAVWVEGAFGPVPRACAVRNARRPLYKAQVGAVTYVASTADIFRRAGVGRCEPLAPEVLYEWRTV